MSDSAQRTVRVELRHVVLAEAAALTEQSGGRVFVALDEPPPVRSVLALVDASDGSTRRAIEVVRVVEVADGDGSRGVHGRVVDADALARFAAVGTERLPGGTREPASTEPTPDPEKSDADANGSQLAMPAPVMVVENDSEPIDVSEGDGGDAHEDADGGDGGETQTKKRKGRKRR
jgi:hypothetical protein